MSVGKGQGTGRVDMWSSPTPEFVNWGHLDGTGKMAFQREKLMAKVVSTVTLQLDALNVSPPVRMTPCPHRLQLQTLTGKMIIWRDNCLAKVAPTMLIHACGKPSW